jgi:hypothetical protein
MVLKFRLIFCLHFVQKQPAYDSIVTCRVVLHLCVYTQNVFVEIENGKRL